MSKQLRHQKIIELVQGGYIQTQEELLEQLTASGFDVTQATISRDIRKLQLNKVVMPNGYSKYILPDDSQISNEIPNTKERFQRLFRESVTNIDMAGNIIVIHTLPGAAMGVAAALDSMQADGVLGSIAGDDTVFAIVRDDIKTQHLAKKLAKLT